MSDLNENINKLSDLVTIDPYYEVTKYNEALSALKNNGVKYTEWILTMNPYHFYLDLDGQKPIMMNYNVINRNNWIKMVSKVQPLTSNDEVTLYRRGERVAAIKDFINNDVFNKALKANTSIVFHYKNKEQLFNLSKTYGEIYPIGIYLGGAKRLAICFDSKIKNVLDPQHLELEMKKHKLGELEIKINFDVLRNKEKVTKWIRTPKYKDGKFLPTRPASPLKF